MYSDPEHWGRYLNQFQNLNFASSKLEVNKFIHINMIFRVSCICFNDMLCIYIFRVLCVCLIEMFIFFSCFVEWWASKIGFGVANLRLLILQLERQAREFLN
jgi:hypothetical protein